MQMVDANASNVAEKESYEERHRRRTRRSMQQYPSSPELGEGSGGKGGRKFMSIWVVERHVFKSLWTSCYPRFLNAGVGSVLGIFSEAFPTLPEVFVCLIVIAFESIGLASPQDTQNDRLAKASNYYQKSLDRITFDFA